MKDEDFIHLWQGGYQPFAIGFGDQGDSCVGKRVADFLERGCGQNQVPDPLELQHEDLGRVSEGLGID